MSLRDARIICLSLFAAAGALFAAEGAKVPLKLQLPPPALVGTPTPIRLPNLEPKPSEPPALMVPAGTVNLAAGKPVSASDTAPLLGDPSLITDGDKSADEGCFVEFGPGKQWVQIDLQASSPLFAIWLSHFHAQARAYKAVVIQLSDDADFIQGVSTVFNSDYNNTLGFGEGKDPAYIETYRGRLIALRGDGIKARYVRLYSAGNTTNPLNHYIEVEVYGLPAK